MCVERHERERLTKLLMALVNKWGVHEECKAHLLDLCEEEWAKVKAGEPIPERSAALSRARKLLRIHKMALLVVGRNAELSYEWINRINIGLGGNSPINIMLRDGDRGIDLVIAHLNRQFI